MVITEVDKLAKESEARMKAAVEAINKQFMTVRTDRAHPNLVEHIKVDYYGTVTQLKQLANITAPEPRLIVIQPWDKNSITSIEKAIQVSDLGITPANDGRVIRLSLPQLTQERREELKKVLHRIAEEGRVSIRNARHSAIERSVELEKKKLITEDDKYLAKDRMQELTEKYIKQVDEALAKKEQDISK